MLTQRFAPKWAVARSWQPTRTLARRAHARRRAGRCSLKSTCPRVFLRRSAADRSDGEGEAPFISASFTEKRGAPGSASSRRCSKHSTAPSAAAWMDYLIPGMLWRRTSSYQIPGKFPLLCCDSVIIRPTLCVHLSLIMSGALIWDQLSASGALSLLAGREADHFYIRCFFHATICDKYCEGQSHGAGTASASLGFVRTFFRFFFI